MANLATPEALCARWEEVLNDPSLRDLPYKIELNAWGKVEMAPRSNRCGRLVGEISAALVEQLKEAGVSILVIDKDVRALTRVADRHYVLEKGRVVWAGTSRELAADAALQHRYLGV